MATEAQFNQDDKEKDENGQPIGPTSNPISNSGSIGAPGAPASNVRPATPNGRPNVQQYLDANKGAGQTLANGIGNAYGAQNDKYQAGVNNAQTSFNNASNPLAQKLGDAGSTQINQAFKDPSKLLAQQSQPLAPGAPTPSTPAAPTAYDEFQKLRTGGYGQDINDLSTQFNNQKMGLQSQLNTLGQKADLSGSESGRFQLLRDTFGNPNYSHGQQKLDQLFVQAQPGAARNLAGSLQSQQQQSANQLTGLDNSTKQSLADLGALKTARSDEWNNLLQNGATSGFDADPALRGYADIKQDSQTMLDAAKAKNGDITDFQNRLATPSSLTTDDIQKLGLNQGDSLYDVNLNKNVSDWNLNPTLAGAADPQEFARYRALQQLSGDTSGDIFGGAATAGDYSPYKVSADLQKNIDASKANWESGDPFKAAMAKQLADLQLQAPDVRDNLINKYYSPFSGAKTGQDLEDAYQQMINQEMANTGETSGIAEDATRAWANPIYNYMQELNKRRGNQVGKALDMNAIANSGWKPPSKYEDDPNAPLTMPGKDV